MKKIVRTGTATTLLVLDGKPIDEPVIGYGPFVMNTQQQIHQATADYQEGRFGSIPTSTH